MPSTSSHTGDSSSKTEQVLPCIPEGARGQGQRKREGREGGAAVIDNEKKTGQEK